MTLMVIPSREMNRWPNGIRILYRHVYPCGHKVTVWSNAKNPWVHKVHPNQSPVNFEIRDRVHSAGCIKCVEPAEPLDYQHQGRGGFLRNYKEEVAVEPYNHSMRSIAVNKKGYLVMFDSKDGRRTYACQDLPSLKTLVQRLTERPWDSFVPDERGLPQTLGLTIAFPLHIYQEGR